MSISDDGETSDGGVDTSGDQTFTIFVTAVNDVPSFTKGANEIVLEDAGLQTIGGWATVISVGPTNEVTQSIDFLAISNDNNGLFSVQPAVSPTGELTYTPADDQNGSAIVTIANHEDGGTTAGGEGTRGNQTFTTTVTGGQDHAPF